MEHLATDQLQKEQDYNIPKNERWFYDYTIKRSYLYYVNKFPSI